jgi:trimeric autotransporter adhesin
MTLLGDATINVNANTAAATAAINRLSRDANGRLRDMRGRFVSESRLINTAFNRAAGGGSAFNGILEKLKSAALHLSPALIPIAAQAAPIAASVGAASVAVGAFAAAAAGQVTALTEASEAEKKYKDAVVEHGAASKEAGAASAAYARQMAQMAPATREAAVALSGLKSEYKSWSDGLAGSTMPVATKAMQTFGAIFPKLTPMVQGAGVELNRFVTIAAGGVASPGFDRFMQSFSEFAVGALRKANDALVRFTLSLDAGKVGGGVSQFMEYARANGPLVRDTLAKVATALGNVLEAAANAGPGMLTVVNALAGLVAAVPPGVITALLQLALAMKAVRLAAVAMAATSGAVTAFTASIATMRLAAAGATGVLPRLSAAFGALSASARFGVAAAAVGAMVLAVRALSDQKAPVAVDELSTSLNTLASTGKVTGALKANFDEMSASIAMMSKGASDNKLLQLTSDFGTWVGIASGPSVSDAAKNLDAWDKSMADLVAAGKPMQAAAQFEILKKAWVAGGGDLGRLKTTTNDYQNSLAAQKNEAANAARAMGIFGLQAQDTSAKLAAQKAAADGLRQAINALNEVNQSAYGAQIQFEAAIDSLTASFKEHGATLNVDTAAGQANGQAMLAAAKSQNELVAAGLAAGSSLESMTGKSNKLRGEMLRLATDAFDGNRKKAQAYTDTLLGTPQSITTFIKAERAEALTGLRQVQAEIQKTPGVKTVKVNTLNAAAIKALEAVGLKTRQLPDGRTEVYTANGQAIGSIGAVTRAMNNLNGKVARTYTFHEVKTTYVNSLSQRGQSVHDAVGATGGLFTGTGFKHRGYARGGLVDGPGTETSDDVYAPWLSKNEFVVNARRTRQHLPLLKAINSGGLAAGGMAGGMTSAGMDAGRGLASGLSGATSLVLAAARAMAGRVETGVRAELQIASPSKVMQALGKDTGAGFVKGLTGTREQISRTAASIAESITKAFRGRKTTVDDRLVSVIAFANKRLQTLAAERDRIAQRIADAKKFSADVAAQAKGAFSLQAVTQGPAGVSGDTIRRGLAAAGGQIREFISRINVLRKKGLSKDLLAQIIGMGPEAGLEFANVLSRQSAESLKEINRLQGQINKASTNLGKLSADALFDAGKQSGRGFLAGLAGQQKQIEQLMLSIAKSMQKAIRKALGIKSPSTVMAEVGRQSTLGLAAGLVDRLPAVDQAMSRVAGRVAGVRPTGPALSVGTTRTATASAQKGAVINVSLVNNGVLSGKEDFRNWLVNELDTLKRLRRLPAA